MFKPSYLRLFNSGELKERLRILEAGLESCNLCPRTCRVNRLNDEEGFCRSGYQPYISSIMPHYGEEYVISGNHGSGTVFFGGCNLRCIYCQNWQISQDTVYYKSTLTDFELAARNIVELQLKYDVHNINFVSPSHFVPQMVRIVYEAIKLGLRVPIVYNSNGYDSLAALRLLEGIIDIYMPDFKYADDETAMRYSECPGYSNYTRAAVEEMFRQVGPLKLDKNGVALRGLLVRHLVLPNAIAGSEQIFKWLYDQLGKNVAVSLLAQYHPDYQAHKAGMLSRRITSEEYREAREALARSGLSTDFCQR